MNSLISREGLMNLISARTCLAAAKTLTPAGEVFVADGNKITITNSIAAIPRY